MTAVYKSLVARAELLVDGKVLVVSTINRMSSSMYAPGSWYAETMVFESVDGRLTNIMDQTESLVDSLSGHERMVKKWSKM